MLLARKDVRGKYILWEDLFGKDVRRKHFFAIILLIRPVIPLGLVHNSPSYGDQSFFGKPLGKRSNNGIVLISPANSKMTVILLPNS